MSQLTTNFSNEDIQDIQEILNFKQIFIESLKEHKISKATAKDCRTAFIKAVFKWQQSIDNEQEQKEDSKQESKSKPVMKGCAR